MPKQDAEPFDAAGLVSGVARMYKSGGSRPPGTINFNVKSTVNKQA
jgi:hypothetical protein